MKELEEAREAFEELVRVTEIARIQEATQGPLPSPQQRPHLGITAKTVGELAATLNQLDPSTPFVHITDGHYCVTQKAQVYLNTYEAPLTKVGKTEDGKTGVVPEGTTVYAAQLGVGKLD